MTDEQPLCNPPNSINHNNIDAKKEASINKIPSATDDDVILDVRNSEQTTTDSSSAEQTPPPVTLPSHLFVELTSLDELSFPTSSSTRIRYTCLCASEHYLAVGSTSGAVYLFSRYAARFRKSLSSVPVQVIANKEGSVVRIASSPNEKFLGVATNRGHVSVIALGGPAGGVSGGGASVGAAAAGLGGLSPAIRLESTLHRQRTVTALRWNSQSTRLYVGDGHGRVSCNKIGYRNLFRPACEVLMQLDSSIVQLDCYDERVLASTTTRCYLYNTESDTCRHIGKKLRSGPYGACFYPTDDATQPLIFCGRPNGRIWEVDTDGLVYSTHQFTNLQHVPTCSVVGFRTDKIDLDQPKPKLISFYHMNTIECKGEHFLVVVNDSRICIVEPRKASVLVVCNICQELPQYALSGGDLFYLDAISGDLRKVSLFPFVRAVEKLQTRSNCLLPCARLILMYSSASTQQQQALTSGSSSSGESTSSKQSPLPWKSSLLEEVIAKLKEEQSVNDRPDSDVVSLTVRLEVLLSTISPRVRPAALPTTNDVSQQRLFPFSQRLPTGVHRVIKAVENSGYEDDFTFRAPSPFRHSVCRHRSRSSPASPRRRRTQGGTTVTNADHPPTDDDESLSANGMPLWGLTSRSEESLRTLLDAPRDARHVSTFVPECNYAAASAYTPTNSETNKSVAAQQPEIRLVDCDQKAWLPSPPPSSALRLQNGNAISDPNNYHATSNSVATSRDATVLSLSNASAAAVQTLTPMPAVPAVVRGGRGTSPSAKPKKRTRRKVVVDKDAKNSIVVAVTRPRKPPRAPAGNTAVVAAFPQKEAVVQNGLKDGRGSPSPSLNDQITDATDIDTTMTEPPPRSTDTIGQPMEHRCVDCGLPSSWTALMLLGRHLALAHVAETTETSANCDQAFNRGGIPGTTAEWAQLLSLWMELNRRRDQVVDGMQDSRRLCHKCTSAFELVLPPTNDSVDLLAPSVLEPGDFGSVDSVDVDIAARLFSDSERLTPPMTPSTLTAASPTLPTTNNGGERKDHQETDDPLLYSTYWNPIYSSSSPCDTIPSSSVIKALFWWLSSVRLQSLCVAAAYAVGVDALIDLLTAVPHLHVNDETASNAERVKYDCCLDDVGWATLFNLATGTDAGASRQIDEKIADALFEDVVSLTTECTSGDYGPTEGGASSLIRQSSYARNYGETANFLKGVRIQLNRDCPYCTLSVTTKVSSSVDQIGIVAFECGHVFHRLCLQRAYRRSVSTDISPSSNDICQQCPKCNDT